MGVGAGQQQAHPTSCDIEQYNQTLTPRSVTVRNAEAVNKTMSSICENCSIRFSLLKRKRRCNDCGRCFCSACLAYKIHGEQRRCKQCQSVTNGDFCRQDLTHLKVSHLRTFLLSKNIPTAMCKEKSDLIDLVLENFGGVGYHRSQFEHGREINRLAEKMRRTNDIEGPPRSNVIPSSSTTNNRMVVTDNPIIVPDSEDEDDVNGQMTYEYRDVMGRVPDVAENRGHDDSVIILDDSDDAGADNVPVSSMNATPIIHDAASSNAQGSTNHPTASASYAASVNAVDVIDISDTLDTPDTSINVSGLGNVENTPGAAVNLSVDTDVEMVNERLLDRQAREMAMTEERLREELSTAQEAETRAAKVRKCLEDIKSLDELSKLSVRQLKELLVCNFVDYKGCCERWELEERVCRLWNQKRSNLSKVEDARKRDELADVTNVAENDDDKDICKICMDAAIECVLLECGHMVTCTRCGKQLAECPICRQYVARVVHIFRA